MEFVLPRWEQLPEMDLYLEQVLSLLDHWLGGKLPGRRKQVLTRTMVNNYVKQKIIPPPINRKYEKRSVAALFLIAYLKSVYSISDIARLIALAMGKDDMAPAYNKFCMLTEQAVDRAFSGAGAANEMDYLMQNVAESFACQLFVLKEHLKK